MRFHVLGVGSIGTLIAHHLRHTTTSPISLIFRRAAKLRHTDAEPEGGKELPPPFSLSVQRGKSKSFSTGFDVENYHDGSNHAQIPGSRNGNIDSLLVCLKTVDTVSAIKTISPRLSPNSVITLLQNGMGVYDQLCSTIFPDPATRPQFILGTTTHGVTSTGKHGVVKHMSKIGEGQIKFGVVPDPRDQIDFNKWLWRGKNVDTPITTPPPSPDLPLLHLDAQSNLSTTLNTFLSMSELSPSLLPMPHLHHQLLLKLAINSAINPLTAVLGLGALTNGALIATGPGKRLIHQVTQETSTILTAYIRSMAEPHAPATDVLRLFSPESLATRTMAVAYQTSRNTSSMAADIKAGKLTEIGSINGYFVSLATRLNVPSPTHRMLVEMVKTVSGLSSPAVTVPDIHKIAIQGVQNNVQGYIDATKEESRKLMEEREAARVEIRRKELEIREMEARTRITNARVLRRGVLKKEKRRKNWNVGEERRAARKAESETTTITTPH